MGDTRNYSDPNLAIIERCQKGERKAFQELYNLYAKAMLNTSFRILNNMDEAEEVLQDSFLKAFQKIDTYDPKFAFGSWLKRMVTNASLDVIRKRKNVFVTLDDAQFVQEEENDDEIIYDVETVKKCIAELPDGFRTIISMYLFDEHTHKEIGEILGISEGTIKSHYYKAKKILIDSIKQNTTVHE